MEEQILIEKLKAVTNLFSNIQFSKDNINVKEKSSLEEDVIKKLKELISQC